jgi:hypothetical protein
LYDQQNQIAQALGGTGHAADWPRQYTMGRTFDYNGMTPMVTGVNGQPVQRVNGTRTYKRKLARDAGTHSGRRRPERL